MSKRNDLINRQALIEHLRRTIEASSNDGDYNEGFNDGVDFSACFASTLPSAQPEYEELTPEEAASEIASRSIMSVLYWLDAMRRLEQMGYAICKKR